MSKKQDAYYFQNFADCVDCACNASKILNSTLEDFNAEALEKNLDLIHEQEHAADVKKHEMLGVLIKAFITPIEREDIMLLSQNLDDLVDKIEDVLIKMYCNNITSIRPDALELTKVIVKACEEVKALMVEFPKFKHSKSISEHIVAVNSLEEEADKLFIAAVRNLHTTCKDPIDIIAWHEVYFHLEKCVDACEHIADTVESVIMKNS